MKRITSWIWRQGIVSTFMTGFFVLLPIMITLAIMGWAASWVVQLLGPNSLFGNILEYVGVHLLPNETRIWIATLLGWAIVLIVRSQVQINMSRLMSANVLLSKRTLHWNFVCGSIRVAVEVCNCSSGEEPMYDFIVARLD